MFFLVVQEEPRVLVEHLLERIYLPIPMFLDNERDRIGIELYAQPEVGIPFGRAYVVAPDGAVTAVLTGYDPNGTLDLLEAATESRE